MSSKRKFREIQSSPMPNYGMIQPQIPEDDVDTIDDEWVNVDSIDGWKKIARYWKLQFERKKMAYDNEHQRFISLQGMFEEIQNEFNGMLRKKNVDVEKMRLQEVLSDYAAYKDIQDVVKDTQRQKPWVRITWEIVLLALGMVFIWQVASNIAFRTWLSDNMIAIVILIVAIVVLFVILKPKKIDKKK